MGKKVKTLDSDIFLEQQLKNEEFRKEYELLEEEFEIAKTKIKNQKNHEYDLKIMKSRKNPYIDLLKNK